MGAIKEQNAAHFATTLGVPGRGGSPIAGLTRNYQADIVVSARLRRAQDSFRNIQLRRKERES
jgi:hypothetical protein